MGQYFFVKVNEKDEFRNSKLAPMKLARLTMYGFLYGVQLRILLTEWSFIALKGSTGW